MINSYKDLKVWQKGVELSVLVYKLTEGFPKEETYGLTSQMRRCSVSIPSNIAEGSSRGTRKDYINFLRMALGSTSELRTQIEIAKQVVDGNESNFVEIDILLDEVVKMLKGLISSLSASPKT